MSDSLQARASLDPLSQNVLELRTQFGDDAVDRQLRFLEQYRSEIDDPILWLHEALRGDFKGMPIERVRTCPCGSTRIDLLVRFVFWNLLGVSQCQECGLIMTSPRLTVEAVEKVFSTSYFDTEHPELWGARREPVFREVLHHLQRLGARTVVDVGTGYGHLLEFLAKHDVAARGCDISSRAVAWGREHLGVDVVVGLLHELPTPTETVDCMVCLDTLYYSADPLRDLKVMREYVRPGGHVLLRLRNGTRVEHRAARLPRGAIVPQLYPAEHLWSFTPRTIGLLLERAGLTPVLMEPAAHSRTRGGWVLSAWHHATRSAHALFPRTGMPGLSFNVIARRPE